MSVSGPTMWCSEGRIARIWCIFMPRMTRSWTGTSVSEETKVEVGDEVTVVPSSLISFRASALCIAARCAPRAKNVTSWPRRESSTPRRPPIAPAPTTHIVDFSRLSMLVADVVSATLVQGVEASSLSRLLVSAFGDKLWWQGRLVTFTRSCLRCSAFP